MNSQSESGYSTIETVLAVGVLGITVTTSLQSEELAHRLRENALEALRALYIAESAIEQARGQTNDYMDRTIKIDQNFTEYLTWQQTVNGHQVTVTVEWNTPSGKQQVEIDSYVP